VAFSLGLWEISIIEPNADPPPNLLTSPTSCKTKTSSGSFGCGNTLLTLLDNQSQVGLNRLRPIRLQALHATLKLCLCQLDELLNINQCRSQHVTCFQYRYVQLSLLLSWLINRLRECFLVVGSSTISPGLPQSSPSSSSLSIQSLFPSSSTSEGSSLDVSDS